MATTGSLLASHDWPSLVESTPFASNGTKTSVQLPPAPAFSEKAYLVVLKPPRCEKSLIAATSFAGSRGSTAMCSSAAGNVVVAETTAPAAYGAPLITAG